MVDAPSIGELCYHARCACVMAGLTPVAWRWSWAAWKLFEQEMKHYMLVSHIPGNPQPGLPPGCHGLYEGLPIYLMHIATTNPTVACIGSREKPAF